VKLDGAPLVDHWVASPENRSEAKVNLTAGKTYLLEVDYFQAGGEAVGQLDWRPPSAAPFAEAVALAEKADAAIVCVSTDRTEGEARDRSTMDLPNDQDELICRVAAANPRTVVVLNNGTPVTMKGWIDQVPAVLEAWLPGQEGGGAVADLLFGKATPSGKLPTTFGIDRADYPDLPNFPGKNGVVSYAEGIYVGYRHFDKEGIVPLFPFGYGLSYTTFDYRNLQLSTAALAAKGEIVVTADIANTGPRPGAEVVELYVHDPHPKIDRPVRELRGFTKIPLEPGETGKVTFHIRPRDFAYFDVGGKQWKADAGRYEIELASSSRDIRLKAPVDLTETFTDPVPLSEDHSHDPLPKTAPEIIPP